MPMSHSASDHQPERTPGSVVIIDHELLSQDCLAEAMRGEFPQMTIIGMPTISDLYRPREVAVEAVLLRIRPCPSNLYDLTHEVTTVCQYFAHAPVIVLSPRDDMSSIEAAAAAGARGFIPITVSFKIAVAALRLVLAGGTYYPHLFSRNIKLSNTDLEVNHESTVGHTPDLLVSPALSKDVSHVEFENKHLDGFNAAFTAREIDVLTALRQGRSNKWIAHHLELSENTIKVHIRHIMRKLHATNRTEAVVLSQSLLANGNANVNANGI